MQSNIKKPTPTSDKPPLLEESSSSSVSSPQLDAGGPAQVLQESPLYSTLTVEEYPFGTSVFDEYDKILQLEEGGTGEVWLVQRKSKEKRTQTQQEQEHQVESTMNDNSDTKNNKNTSSTSSNGTDHGISHQGVNNVDEILHDNNDDDKLYAVKVIEKDFLFGVFMKELRNEIENLRAIDHPHVIRIYEIFETREYLYLVMEYCKGGDLSSRLSSMTDNDQSGNQSDNTTHRITGMEEDQAARILTQILSAVAHCHKHKMIHRDLKLENILFRTTEPDSDVVLIDFGCAQRNRNRNLAREDYVMKMNVGTNYTISPQVVTQDGSMTGYTEKTDLWSVGVIAYMLLSGGELPFDAPDDKDIPAAILRGQYDMNHGPVWPHVSDAAKAFVASLLEYKEENRVSAEEALRHPWLLQHHHAAHEEITILQQESNKERCDSFHVPSEVSQQEEQEQQQLQVLHEVEDALVHSATHEPTLKRVAKMIIAHNMSAQKLQTLREAFTALDKSNDGTISYAEFKTALLEHQQQQQQDETNDTNNTHYDEEQFREIFAELDPSNTGVIHFTEFLSATLESQVDIEQEQLDDAFEKLDVDNEGIISKEGLTSILESSTSKKKKSKHKKSDSELVAEDVLKEVDGDSEEKVTYEEFSEMF